jgi:branched-chain amino acid transport system permease protein
VAVSLGLLFSSLAGALVGMIARRSRGIYAIMITLAIGVAFFYFTRQNYSLFNGWTGFSGVRAPEILETSLRAPVPFYFLSLAVSVLALGLVACFVRSPLGLTIQAVRDAPGRVLALGIPTTFPIVAAFAFSGFLAGMGGVLNVWLQERISSFTVGLGPIIDILIISVIGGLRHPTGAFIGAVVFVFLDTFAVDLIDRERFNTLIGLVLLAIVIVAPNGIQEFGAKLIRQFLRSSRNKDSQSDLLHGRNLT